MTTDSINVPGAVKHLPVMKSPLGIQTISRKHGIIGISHLTIRLSLDIGPTRKTEWVAPKVIAFKNLPLNKKPEDKQLCSPTKNI